MENKRTLTSGEIDAEIDFALELSALGRVELTSLEPKEFDTFEMRLEIIRELAKQAIKP
jgi:hypothetical protein